MSDYTDDDVQTMRDALPARAAVYCRAALDRVAPAIVRRAKAEAWQEGFDRAEHMARCWGHTDYWGEADPYPTNPYADGIEATR